MWTENYIKTLISLPEITATRRNASWCTLHSSDAYQEGYLLFQIPEESTVIQFQVKKIQRTASSNLLSVWVWSWFWLFPPSILLYKQNRVHPKKNKNSLMIITHPPQKNYWDRSLDFSYDNLSVSQNSHFYKLFYSDRFSNLPLGVSPTGNTFKTTIPYRYLYLARWWSK